MRAEDVREMGRDTGLAAVENPSALVTCDLDKQAAIEWDRAVGRGSLYARAAWTSQATPATVARRYYRIPDGAVPGFIIGADCPVSPYASAGGLVPLLLGLVGFEGADPVAGAILPTLSLGGLVPHYQTLATAGEGADRTAAARRLLRAALADAKGLGLASVSYLYADERDPALAVALAAEGFVSFYSGERWDLPVVWASFDDYLAHFKRRRRDAIRRELQLLEEAGVRLTAEELDERSLHSIAEHRKRHLAKHGRSVSVEEAMSELANLSHQDAVVFVARRGEQALGYTVGLRTDDDLYMRTTAIDPVVAGGLPVYFGVGYYEPMRYATDEGIRELHYGATAGQAKRLRGCVRTAQRGWLHLFDAKARGEFAGLLALLHGPVL